MRVSWSSRHQSEFIEYNLFHFWIQLWKIPWMDCLCFPLPLSRLMARRNIKYLAWRIARCIGINYCISYDGGVTIPLLGSQWSLLIGCRLWVHPINDIRVNLDHRIIISEDLETKSGILSLHWVLGDNGRDTARVWKELCYRKAET
jgi:hypothetical protein